MKFKARQKIAEHVFETDEAGRLIEKYGPADPEALPPLVLAFVGDAVFHLYVRKRLLSYTQTQVNLLNDFSAKIVSAVGQAQAYQAIETMLTEEEQEVFRRGRNAQSRTPRTASVQEYHISTGFEALLGTLYLNNVIDSFATGDNLFTLVPSFYVSTIVGKTADIGDGSGFTPDLADNLAKEKNVKPEKMFGTATREDILYQALELCGEQFIDWENSSCSFDSPEFIRLMQFISQFPAKIENTQEEDTSADYRSGKSLFYRESIGAFDEYVNLKYGVFGEEITLAGFPSAKPGSAAIFPQLQIAINSSSKNKEACWSFVRRFLLDDYQNSLEMYWPVSIEALDQLANKAMEPLYYEDENGNQVEDHIIVNIGGEDIKLPRISDSEVDQMYGFLKGLTSDAYFDSNVENIVAEETAAFFEGQKSAEDVAGVIQSRVQIYINENS